MEYLTYQEYQQFTNGGTVSVLAFPILQRKAARKLDYFTQNRLKTVTVIIAEVKELMTEYIDIMSTQTQGSDLISSYSNGIESISYQNNSKDDTDRGLYELAIEYLPIELISCITGTDIEQDA